MFFRGRRMEPSLAGMTVSTSCMVASPSLFKQKPGDIVRRGERFGMIKLGSRVDVYLPPEVRAEVKLGERVFAGRTVLGGMAVEK